MASLVVSFDLAGQGGSVITKAIIPKRRAAMPQNADGQSRGWLRTLTKYPSHKGAFPDRTEKITGHGLGIISPTSGQDPDKPPSRTSGVPVPAP